MTSSTQTQSQRIRSVILKLQREAVSAVELAEVRGRREILERTERELATIERAAQALSAAARTAYVSPDAPPTKHLKDFEREAALLQMAHGLARRSGAWLASPAQLYCGLLENALDEDLPFWRNHTPGQLVSLLRQSNLVGPLKERGVLLWEGHEGLWRLVDTNAVTAHAEIYDLVVDVEGRAGRCKFCGLEDRPQDGSDALRPAGERGDLTHAPCKPYWLGWLAIARAYRSHEEAAAADAKTRAAAA